MAPSERIVDSAAAAFASATSEFVARLLDRVIMCVMRSRTVTRVPTSLYIALSESSVSSSEYGDPSTIDPNSFTSNSR